MSPTIHQRSPRSLNPTSAVVSSVLFAWSMYGRFDRTQGTSSTLRACAQEPGRCRRHPMFIVSAFFYSLLRGSKDSSHLCSREDESKSDDTAAINIASPRDFF